MKKTVSVVFALVLCMSLAASAFAQGAENNNDPARATAAAIIQYSYQFDAHAEELQPTLEEPYKEVTLDDGTVLFASISVSAHPQYAAKSGVSARAVSSNTMTSSQGVKNVFGWVLYKLDYNTTWSYDYDTVLSSYSWTEVDNGLGWSFKTSTSNGPGSLNNGKSHQWTGTAQFAMVVGGIDVSNETLTNIHRVDYNGEYAWKYEVS